MPLSTFYGLGEPGSEIALRIHTHVREDALVAVRLRDAARAGALRAADRHQRHRPEAGAGGAVGHRAAGADSRDRARRLARLTAIPGVGKKTSERIVLELKDRLPRLQPEPPVAGGGGRRPSALRDDVLSALINLGYHRPLAEKAVDAAVKATPGRRFRTDAEAGAARAGAK